MDLDIFPAPRQARINKSRIDITDSDWIILPDKCDPYLQKRIMDTASVLQGMLLRAVHVSATIPAAGKVLLAYKEKKDFPDQGFELKINTQEKTLSFSDAAGAFYGTQAFQQLVEQFGNNLPSLTIKDAPDFAQRGVMLDVSRCKVPTLATIKQLIDQFAAMRFNQLQLYIEHTFAFTAHQQVWHDASPITHEDVLELDAYCKERFIELVPNLNSFGHLQRWLRHPEYRHLGECPDQKGCSTLAPNNASLALLNELYDEFLPQP